MNQLNFGSNCLGGFRGEDYEKIYNRHLVMAKAHMQLVN